MAFGDNATLLDDFNRANETPLSGGGNWAKLNSADGTDLNLNTNAVTSSAATTGSRYWTPTTYGPDTEVYCTVGVKPPDTEQIGLLLRVQQPGGSNTWDGYQLLCIAAAGTDTFQLSRVTNNAATVLNTTAQEYAVGEKLGLRMYGNRLESWLFTGGAWLLVSVANDNTFASAGNVGIRASSTTTRIDDVYAGLTVVGDVAAMQSHIMGHNVW